jgi:hypothetical protein
VPKLPAAVHAWDKEHETNLLRADALLAPVRDAGPTVPDPLARVGLRGLKCAARRPKMARG